MLQKSDVLSVFGGMEVHAGIIQNAAVAEGEEHEHGRTSEP
jgi:hypothetical protein